LDSITGKELQAHVKYLADPKLKGRSSGTRGCDIAARFLLNQFKRSGVAAGAKEGKSYYQTFRITLKMEIGPRCALALFQRPKAKVYNMKKDFTPFSFAPNAVAKRKVVFAGYGITAPEYEWDDYAGIEAKGKVVLCFRHEPRANDPESKFKGKESTEHAYFLTKVLNAQAHGAKGIIIVNGPRSPDAKRDRLLPLRGGRDPRVKIPAVFALMKVAKDILLGSGETLDGLQHKLDEEGKNASFVIKRKVIGVNTDIERRSVPTHNVLGYIEGSDPELKSEVVILGAHYDHIGTGLYGSRLGAKGRGKVHPGADDNASGTAAVLEIAQAFSLQEEKPKRSLLFIGFSGEERGLLGAGYYVSRPVIPLEKTAAMLNLDMISRGPEGAAGVTFVGTWAKWPEILREANERLELSLRTSPSGSGASDHAPFYRSKIPCLFFAAGLHADYHTPGDTWDKAKPVTMEGITKLAYLVALATANHPVKPEFAQPQARQAKLPYLGIVPGKEVKDLGITLDDVKKDSPAEKGGMKKGDILAEFDGRQIRKFQDLQDVLAQKKVGDEVTVVVYRVGAEMELTVKLGARPKK
jgi:hypothetical protein